MKMSEENKPAIVRLLKNLEHKEGKKFCLINTDENFDAGIEFDGYVTGPRDLTYLDYITGLTGSSASTMFYMVELNSRIAKANKDKLFYLGSIDNKKIIKITI